MPIRAEDTRQLELICPGCDGEMAPIVQATSSDGFPILEKSICLDCSYIHFTRLPGANWFIDYYKDIWDARRQRPKSFDPASGGYSRNLELLRKYNVAKSASIFDFGAGYGQFMTACRLQGYSSLFGSEASMLRAEYCRAELGLQVVLSDGESLLRHTEIEATAPYDVVHSHHVLEHVADADECMAVFTKLLKPNGLLMLHMPFVESEHFVLMGLALFHLRQFCTRSLAALLHRHGFEILEMNEEISVVAQKTNGKPKAKPYKGLNWTGLEDKLNRDFGTDIGGLSQGQQMWFDLKSRHKGMRRAFEDRKLSAHARAMWRLKRAIYGVSPQNLPIFGPSGSWMNALRLANLSAKLHSRFIGSGALEFGARVQRSDDACSALPLVDFRFSSDTAIALIK